MFRHRFKLSALVGLGILVVASVGALAWSFVSSFRLSSDEISLALQANSARLAILFVAGFAQCAGFSALEAKIDLSKHVRFYLCLVLICASLIVVAITSMPIWCAMLLVIATGVLTYYLSGKLRSHTSLGRLILGVVLYATFVLSIAVYFAASTQFDNVYGGLISWLFSNTGASNHSATWELLTMLVLIASLVIVKDRELLAISVIAVAVGLVGPLIFLAYFAVLVVPSDIGLRCKMLVAGLLGGTFIVVTSSVIQLMFGGYAPALIIPLAFMFIPLILLCSGDRVEAIETGSYNQKHRAFERVLLAIIVAISLAVVLHVNEFAQGLI